MAVTIIQRGLAAAVCVAALASAACSSNSPAAASTTTTVATPAPVVPAPVVVLTGSVDVTITPSPVPYSGLPITDSAGCAGSPNTWFYTQNLTETGGLAVTFTSRVDSFDQRVTSTTANLSLVVPAKGTLVINSRWCSTAAVSHTAQTTFTGADSSGKVITIVGPIVNLRSP